MREYHFAAKEGREPKTIPIQMTPDELAEFRSNRAFWAQIEVPK
jgi:hypothetical protein